MSKSLNPLKKTTQELHRFWFKIANSDQWYAIMKECRQEFGKNWQCQGKVLRKINQQKKFGYYYTTKAPMAVWFDIPDPALATWIAIKLGIEVYSDSNTGPTINN